MSRAVVRTKVDGGLDHVERLVEVHPLVDPGVAQVVQHLGLVGVDLQRL